MLISFEFEAQWSQYIFRSFLNGFTIMPLTEFSFVYLSILKLICLIDFPCSLIVGFSLNSRASVTLNFLSYSLLSLRALKVFSRRLSS